MGMNWTYLLAVVVPGLVLLVTARPLKRWYRKVHRRRGGVYLVRCDHHLNRARRVNGYVGETVSHHLRQRQHLGVSRYGTDGQVVKSGVVKVPSQPWSDLNPVWHKLTLPWWLCWKWVLRPLETVGIGLFWPVYNDAKNHWNPRRIPKSVARAQRHARDMGGMTQNFRVGVMHAARWMVRAAGVLVIATGLIGYAVTR